LESGGEIMKKQLISALLCSALMVSIAAGCGSTQTTAASAAPAAAPAAAPSTAPSVAESAAPASAAPAASAAAAAFGGATKKDEKVITIQGKEIPRPAGGYKFGYTCMDGTNPFFVTIQNEIKKKVEANGDTLISTDPANKVSLQITQVEDMISQGINAIFMNPAEADGILPALDELKKAGIPIINFDTEVSSMGDYCFSYVGSDNYNAGKVCGDDLVKKCPNGGNIIVIDSPTMNSVVDRTNGFVEAIKGHGFTIVAQQDGKGNLQKSMGIAEDLLQSHGDVVAIFGGNDPTALGCLAAANAAGLKKTLIYGVDGSPDFKSSLVKSGSLLQGTGAQSPVSIADTSVDVLYKFMKGEPVDSRYPVKTFLITNDNVAKYGTTAWQ
jgi:ribose transport system substrate-binding protein